MFPGGIDDGRLSSVPDKREPAGNGMLVAFIPCLLTADGILENESARSYLFLLWKEFNKCRQIHYTKFC